MIASDEVEAITSSIPIDLSNVGAVDNGAVDNVSGAIVPPCIGEISDDITLPKIGEMFELTLCCAWWSYLISRYLCELIGMGCVSKYGGNEEEEKGTRNGDKLDKSRVILLMFVLVFVFVFVFVLLGDGTCCGTGNTGS